MQIFKELAGAFVRGDQAATMIEYALLVVLIAMIVAIAALALGQAISTQFGNVQNCITTPSAANCSVN